MTKPLMFFYYSNTNISNKNNGSSQQNIIYPPLLPLTVIAGNSSNNRLVFSQLLLDKYYSLTARNYWTIIFSLLKVDNLSYSVLDCLSILLDLPHHALVGPELYLFTFFAWPIFYEFFLRPLPFLFFPGCLPANVLCVQSIAEFVDNIWRVDSHENQLSDLRVNIRN